jgi:SOS-response transcriptional repressor LexA
MKMGKRIESAMLAAELNQTTLAGLMGVTPQAVQQWISGETSPKGKRLELLAEVLRVSAYWLLTGNEPRHENIGTINAQLSGINESKISGNIEPGPDIKGKIPLINYVQAGKWCEIMDIHEPVEWIERTVDVSEKAFALRVVGDSMTNPFGVPSIPEGFIVIVDPAIQASSGSIVVARLENSNEAVLKQLIIDGPNTYLKSLNPDYRPIFINENCTICGVVKKVQFEL